MRHALLRASGPPGRGSFLCLRRAAYAGGVSSPDRDPARGVRAVVPQFFQGVGFLLRGVGFWSRRPGAMALGILPALIVAGAAIAVLLVVALNIPSIGALVTPFADGWDAGWRDVVRVVAGLALALGLLVVVAVGFTTVTLAVGDPFYERIWRAVEKDRGHWGERHPTGFWRGVGDSLRLVLRAVLTGGLLALLALIPVAGIAISFVLGVFLSGRLLALELTTRPLEARGLSRADRRRLLRSRNPLVLGFGAAVHLCFLVPLGAVFVMPAAVAGSTLLAHEVLGEGEAGMKPLRG